MLLAALKVQAVPTVKTNYHLKTFYSMYAWIYVYAHTIVLWILWMAEDRQLVGVSSLPLCHSQASNPSHQAPQQMPLPAQPSLASCLIRRFCLFVFLINVLRL